MPGIWGRLKHKLTYKKSITNFNDALSNLRFICKTRKQRLVLYLDIEDIESLEAIHAALFANKKMRPARTEKKSYGSEIYKLLKEYSDRVVALPIVDPELQRFRNEQVVSILNIPRKAKNADELFDESLDALKLLVKPEFTAALRRTLPSPIPDPLEISAAALNPNLQPSLGSAARPFDADMWAAANLDGLFGNDNNPSERDLLIRLSKQSAMRALNLNERPESELHIIFDGTIDDFNRPCTNSELITRIKTSVDRLSEKTLEKTLNKRESQYDVIGGVKIREQHETGKVKLYQDKFQVAQANPDQITICRKDDNSEVFNITLQNDSQMHIYRAALTIPSTANAKFETQAILVDQLRQMALALGAISVKVYSRDPNTNSINLDNVLKGAFNALHANLVPRFDAETWQAIEQHAATATEYKTQRSTVEPNAYSGRYQSKQFADFLLSINPQIDPSKSYEEIYSSFSDLQRALKYEPIYPLNRRKNR